MRGKLLVVLMALMAPSMAISDSEFIAFVNGALANEDVRASLNGDTLEVVGYLSPYSDQDLSAVSYGLWKVMIELDKVVERYPDRIKYVQMTVKTSDGSGDLARATFAVN
jgi:hypothetical protein